MMRNLLKIFSAIGVFKSSATLRNVGSGSNGDRTSATVRPDPGATFADYDAWLETCPSALDLFDQMMSMAKGKRIVVFLDYDGTLSPIVDDPDLAFMSEAVIKLSSILIPRNTFPTTDIFHKVISLLACLLSMYTAPQDHRVRTCNRKTDALSSE
ncbi:hypothetical protein Dimus_007685 [Dionaea muscipula]